MTNGAKISFWRVQARMMAAQPVRYGVALFLWIGIWTMPVLVGLIAARFFEALVDGVDRNGVAMAVVALFGYAAFRAVFIVLGMRNHASLLFRAGNTMRRNLLVRIYELPGAVGTSETPGQIVSKFRDDTEHIVQPFDLFVDFVGGIVSGTISFAIMYSIAPTTTLIVAIPVVVVGVVANRTGGLVRRYRTVARDTTEAITGFLGETFGAIQSVKVAGAESHMLSRFNSLNNERRLAMIKDRTLTSVLEATFRSTVNVGTGIVLLLAAGTLNATGSSGMSLAQFALFVYLLALVTDSAYFYGVYIARSKQGSVSMERLSAVMAGQPWQRIVKSTELGLDSDTPTAPPYVGVPEPFESLSIRGLTFHYGDTHHGIDDVDLDIAAGEFVVITGRIGSGKTTLVRTILGLLPRDSGTITWNGEEVNEPSTWCVPPRVAYTPQAPKLFSMSLRENLILGSDLESGRLEESIYIATMEQDIEAMTGGLETMIGPRGVRLSGGQIQRSAAARMLTRPAQLLVLDDVSSALDVETEQTLWRRLSETRKGVASLVISHRHAALARADRVIVMENGRIVAVGTASELTKTSETFQAIWEGAQKGTRRNGSIHA